MSELIKRQPADAGVPGFIYREAFGRPDRHSVLNAIDHRLRYLGGATTQRDEHGIPHDAVERSANLAAKIKRIKSRDAEALEEIRNFGEPIAVPIPIYDVSAAVEPAPQPVGVRLSKRRAKIINTLLSSPDAPATPYWRDFMRRNADRIVRFARTAANKGKDIDPQFR